MSELPWGGDLNYWKSGRSDPDSWIEKVRKLVESLDESEWLSEAFAYDKVREWSAYVVQFKIGVDGFRIAWPVLQHLEHEKQAARRQAATMLYHDVKSLVVKARVLGARVAFLPHLVLVGGHTAGELSNPQVMLGKQLSLPAPQ